MKIRLRWPKGVLDWLSVVIYAGCAFMTAAYISTHHWTCVSWPALCAYFQWSSMRAHRGWMRALDEQVRAWETVSALTAPRLPIRGGEPL